MVCVFPQRLRALGCWKYEGRGGQPLGRVPPADESLRGGLPRDPARRPLTDLHPPSSSRPGRGSASPSGTSATTCAATETSSPRRSSCRTASPSSACRRTSAARSRCGYECDLDETPGVPRGTPYQRVQRGIDYNHLRIGPEGWGRAGTGVPAPRRRRHPACHASTHRARTSLPFRGARVAQPASTRATWRTRRNSGATVMSRRSPRKDPPRADAGASVPAAGGDRNRGEGRAPRGCWPRRSERTPSSKAAKASRPASPPGSPEMVPGPCRTRSPPSATRCARRRRRCCRGREARRALGGGDPSQGRGRTR